MPEVFGQPTSLRSASAAWTTSPTAPDLRPPHARTGSRSTRSSSGRSRSSARTGCGGAPGTPGSRARRSAAASRGTTSSAVRPDGKLSSTTSIHGGRVFGRASDRKTRPRCRRDSAPACWDGRPRRARRLRRRRRSSARGRASCASVLEEDLGGVRDRDLAPRHRQDFSCGFFRHCADRRARPQQRPHHIHMRRGVARGEDVGVLALQAPRTEVEFVSRFTAVESFTASQSR